MLIPATLLTLKAGALVRCDDGFTCIAPWTDQIVQEDAHGLFIQCDGPYLVDKPLEALTRNERHYLDGQLDDDSDVYIGIYHV